MYAEGREQGGRLAFFGLGCGDSLGMRCCGLSVEDQLGESDDETELVSISSDLMGRERLYWLVSGLTRYFMILLRPRMNGRHVHGLIKNIY